MYGEEVAEVLRTCLLAEYEGGGMLVEKVRGDRGGGEGADTLPCDKPAHPSAKLYVDAEGKHIYVCCKGCVVPP